VAKLLARKPRVLKTEFLGALLRNGYIPEEVPPIVTAKFFSAHCKSNYAYWLSQHDALIRLSTEYDIYSVPRATTGRRPLALVNPAAQLGLSLILSENRQAIKEKMARSTISLYDTQENIAENKAFSGLNFEKWHELQDSISSKYPFAVKADISRFFYTIYTHSIPWAIWGKDKAKQNYRKGWFKAHWSNKLDMALQSCQSRETFGVPVGPDTSRIVSEILMSGIEDESGIMSGLDYSQAVRLIDDIYIGKNSKDDAQKALDEVESALWKYNLQLNEEKSSISETKLIYDDYWKRDFDEIKFRNSRFVTDKKKIKHIVDAALYHCEKENSELPAIWACRRLISLAKISKDDMAFVDAFFRLGRDFPSTTKHVAEFLVNNKARLSQPEIRERIEQWIKSLIKYNYGNKNDLELSWVLLIAGIYVINLDKNDFPNFDYVPGSVVFAILGLLKQHGILEFPLGTWDWRSRFKESGIHGTDWLPLYEAVLRKWTKDRKLVGSVSSCPHFSKLLADNVTFLDDNILKVSKIDFRKRILRVSGAKLAASSDSDSLNIGWIVRSSYDP
jgi:hypothetical protein